MLTLQRKWFLLSKHVILIAFFLLPIILGSREAIAKDSVDVVLKSIYKPDICGEKRDRDVVVTVDIGRVTQSDSLFGFNFEITYDTLKLRFTSALYQSTLAEFFEEKGVNFFKKGKINGYAVNLKGSQVSGNRPLMAIYGDYISDCTDSAYVNIEYIEFTDEFQKEVRNYQNTFVYSVVADKADRYIRLNSPLKSVIAENDTTTDIKLGVEIGNQKNLKNLSIEIVNSNEMLVYIDSIESINKKCKIDSLTKLNDKHIIYASLNDTIVKNEEIIKLKIKKKINNDDSSNFKFSINSLNYCNCINKLFPDSTWVNVKKKIEDTTSNIENYKEEIANIYYNYQSEEFVIKNFTKKKLKLKLFNIYGYELGSADDFYLNEELRIDAKKFTNGIYFIVINDNKETYKKILIKN